MKRLDVWGRICGRFTWLCWELGKLGGHELNYVSDIDLIFLHSQEDEDHRDNFFMPLSRLTQRLSRLLSDRFEGDRYFR